jgi:hypothetical protein
MRRFSALFAALACAWALAACGEAGTGPAGPGFNLPVRCEIGRDCAVSALPDLAGGTAAQDALCSGRAAPARETTGFSPLAEGAEIAVIAAAPGMIAAVRDGLPDTAVAAAPAGRDCGNAVLIDHGGGWLTQYCHLARGSIAVAEGQDVERAAVLGRMGRSGSVAAPELALLIRHNGRPMDPFSADAVESRGRACTPAPGPGLWTPATFARLADR